MTPFLVNLLPLFENFRPLAYLIVEYSKRSISPRKESAKKLLILLITVDVINIPNRASLLDYIRVGVKSYLF